MGIFSVGQRLLDLVYVPPLVSSHVAAAAAQARAVVEDTFETPPVSSFASASTSYLFESAAKSRLAQAATVLTTPSRWTDISGFENANFTHFDATGTQTARTAVVGDFIRIQLPAMPVSDWVRVESIVSTPDKTQVVVRPSYDPTERPLRKHITAHFFTNRATNTFTVERVGRQVIASVEGRNEVANVGKQSDGVAHALRNRAVTAGAWGLGVEIPGTNTVVNGMQQHQWNVFTENLVE